MSLRHLLLAGCFLACIPPAAAQPRNSDKQQNQGPTQVAPPRANFPEPGMMLSEASAPPILKYMMTDSGTRLVSLGEMTPNSGVVGYLAESSDGKFQTFYLMPDGVTLIAGLAFRFTNGSPQPSLENVTARQVAEMRNRLDASRQTAEESRRRAVDAAESARKRAEDAAQSQRGRIEELEERTQQADAAQRQLERISPIPPPKLVVPAPVANVAPSAAPSPEAQLPATVPALPRADATPSIPQLPQNSAVDSVLASIPVSPIGKDDFMGALNDGKTVWFDLGPANAPMLVMVMDPKCPFCHRAWTVISPMITERKLRARIVLIAGLPESDGAAISLLSKPGNGLGQAFWKGQGSAAAQPIDAPPPSGSPEYEAGINALRNNMAFIGKFGQIIRRTPFMAYVAADGKLRSLTAIEGLDQFLRGLPTSPAVNDQR